MDKNEGLQVARLSVGDAELVVTGYLSNIDRFWHKQSHFFGVNNVLSPFNVLTVPKTFTLAAAGVMKLWWAYQ
jgi:hypothetical protein